MPADPKTVTAAETETPTKGKKSPANNSKAALARITLLDGSILDVTIDVSSWFGNIFTLNLIVFIFSVCSAKQRDVIC